MEKEDSEKLFCESLQFELLRNKFWMKIQDKFDENDMVHMDIISATRAYEANLTVVDATKKIVVKYTVTKKLFKVIIEDSGMKAQIEFMQGRSLNDVRPGGLGIHFIRRVFDGFRFDERKKKGNRLILSRTLQVKK